MGAIPAGRWAGTRSCAQEPRIPKRLPRVPISSPHPQGQPAGTALSAVQASGGSTRSPRGRHFDPRRFEIPWPYYKAMVPTASTIGEGLALESAVDKAGGLCRFCESTWRSVKDDWIFYDVGKLFVFSMLKL